MFAFQYDDDDAIGLHFYLLKNSSTSRAVATFRHEEALAFSFSDHFQKLYPTK